jgi:hypothetical protein
MTELRKFGNMPVVNCRARHVQNGEPVERNVAA